jgi:prophage regulatory protein
MRFIRRHELIRLTGLSRPTLDRLERAGSFPLRRRLSAGAVGWVDVEVEEWLKSRASRATAATDDEQSRATGDAIRALQLESPGR